MDVKMKQKSRFTHCASLLVPQTEDTASTGDESSEPDFDDVPDEREAMMSKREELKQKQVLFLVAVLLHVHCLTYMYMYMAC